MARKLKLTPKLTDEICEFIRKGQNIKDVCQFVGIDESTYYKWLKKGETAKSGVYFQFFKSIKKAESQAKMAAVSMILSAGKRTWQAAAWYLERKYPDEWGKREKVSAEVEHKGEITKKEEYEVTINQRVEQYADLYEKLAERN